MGAVNIKPASTVQADALDSLRAAKRREIEAYGLSLLQARIPALESFAMVAFLRTLWPTLMTPESQPDLAYARDVYVYAMDKLTQLETATREQVEGYDPAQDVGWPG